MADRVDRGGARVLEAHWGTKVRVLCDQEDCGHRAEGAEGRGLCGAPSVSWYQVESGPYWREVGCVMFQPARAKGG